MSLIPPVTVPSLDGFGYVPFPDAQPFSQRAASGYQESLEDILKYLRYLNTYLTAVNQQSTWDSNVAALIAAVQSTLAAQSSDNAAKVTAALNAIANSEILITDPAMLAVLSNASTQTRALLDAIPRTAPAGSQQHSWNPALHLYNEESPWMVRLRERIQRAPLEGPRTRIGFLGDSKTAGFGANNGGALDDGQSLPGQFRSMIGAGEGTAFANTFHGLGHDGIDWRWSNVVGLDRDATQYDGQVLYLRTTKGAAVNASATFTSTTRCDGVSVYVWAGGTGPVSVTVTIDGVDKPAVQLTNPANWTKLNFTGLTAGIHTVKIAAPVTTVQEFAILGVEPYLLNQNRVVTNIGICSATAGRFAPSNDFTQPYPSAVFAGFDIGIINLGTNRAGDTLTALTAICNDLLNRYNAPVLLTMPGILDASYDDLRTDLYGLADTFDLPLLDYRHLTGLHDEATSRRLTADTLHENRAGYALEAAAVKAALFA